jgi:tetratricopeptide (TPR) repeat protein
MIVRDEAHCIKECLAAARPHVDEIVVVDTGSLDNTIELAKPFTDILEHFTWIDDFSAARNYSLELASQPWILVLDADEMLSETGYSQLRQLTPNELTDGYFLTCRRYLDDSEGDEAMWQPVTEPDPFSRGYGGYIEHKILRFFRNTGVIRYSGRIHEIVDSTIMADRAATRNIMIYHYHENPDNDSEQHIMRNLKIQEILISSDTATARDYLSAGSAHLLTTQHFDKAEEYLSKALEMGADAGETLEALAITHYKAGRLQQATAIFQTLYDSGRGSSSVLNNLSNLLIKAGDLEGSAHLLEQLLNLGVENPARRERIQQNLITLRHAIAEQQHTSDN